LSRARHGRGSGNRRPRRRGRKASGGLSISKDFIESVVMEVVPRLGLSILGLSSKEYVEMMEPLVKNILESYSSRPSPSSIASRISSNPEPVYTMAAAYIFEKGLELTEERVEFIVLNAPIMASSHVAELYRKIRKLGRKDLLVRLRIAWETYGKPSPIACPQCGFRAVTPQLYCLVCGRELSEEEAKNAIDLRERLRELIEVYGVDGAREVIEEGIIVVGEEVKPPSRGINPGEIVLKLSPEEIRELKEILALSVKRTRNKLP